MTATLRAEWAKLTTTRTFHWLLAGTAAVAAVTAFATTSSVAQPPWSMTAPLHDQTMWVLATVNGAIFAIVLGGRTFTDEHRHHTIAHTYIADPRRTTSTIAKAGAAALSGVLVGTATVGALLVVSLAMALASGGRVQLHASDLLPTVGLLTAMGLWAVIGAGFGAVVRTHVAVVAVGLVWVLMLESLGAGLMEDTGRFLPGQAVHAMARTREAIDLLPALTAAVVMVGHAGLAVLTALVVVRRRDVV